MTIPTLKKFGAVMMISDEQLFTLMGFDKPEYQQKANKVVAPPTSEDWALYYQALAGLRALEAYKGTEWGGPDYGTEVLPPTDTVTYEWLETHDEWLARCRALRNEES